ncbi:MAG: rod shape-determining protein MreC [Aquificaceae bacterium]|nr:rod shape-determining protein MreC [Aquificaceae bacterium]
MKGQGHAFLLLFLSLLLYFSSPSTLPYLNKAYNLLRLLVQPLFELKGLVVENTKYALETYVLLSRVSEENHKLRAQLEECAIYKTQLKTCESNLFHISKLIELTPELKHYPLLYANVIAYDPSGNDAFLVINKGQGAGLREGMVIFHGDNLVGIVDRVYGGSSRVRTVFSQEFSISALSGDKAYIYKGGYPYGSLLHVNLEDEIRVGDGVFLRVPGKNFPQLTIGTVQSVYQEGKSFFKRVEVKPAVDVRRVSLCIVIREEL